MNFTLMHCLKRQRNILVENSKLDKSTKFAARKSNQVELITKPSLQQLTLRKWTFTVYCYLHVEEKDRQKKNCLYLRHRFSTFM